MGGLHTLAWSAIKEARQICSELHRLVVADGFEAADIDNCVGIGLFDLLLHRRRRRVRRLVRRSPSGASSEQMLPKIEPARPGLTSGVGP